MVSPRSLLAQTNFFVHISSGIKLFQTLSDSLLNARRLESIDSRMILSLWNLADIESRSFLNGVNVELATGIKQPQSKHHSILLRRIVFFENPSVAIP